MIKLIAVVGYFVMGAAWALIPAEGLLMGEASPELQTDPLRLIFNDRYNKSLQAENKKVRLYEKLYQDGTYLKESCHQLTQSAYSTSWMEKQAKRSAASTLQYIGLDTSIKAIAAYAKLLEMSEADYQNLSSNLVNGFCSQNVTVFSLKRIRESLNYYYKNPETTMIPSVQSSPFATEVFKARTESSEARSQQFDYAISNFKAFCSWGGDVADYRMLAPYLNNSFIFAFVINNLASVQNTFDEISQSVKTESSPNTVQVLCDELICRKVSFQEFQKGLPMSLGSTGLRKDLTKLYCHHFRFQDYSSQTIPDVKSWIKKAELEDPILETNFFLSLISGVPDPFFGISSYQDIALVAKGSMDERWNLWAKEALGSFSRNLMYEESLKVKSLPLRNKLALRTQGFMLDFSVTLGEMDRLTDTSDKLGLSFDLQLSKNFLRQLKVRMDQLISEVDEEGIKKYKQEVASYIQLQLKEKVRLFSQTMWNEDLSYLIAEELIAQVHVYQGPLFQSYGEKMLVVPVKFSYGLFALNYLRYRADVKSGRLKLNL
jgi:hypothetical protein